MLRKCLLAGLAVIFLLTSGLLISCGGGGSPSGVVKSFYAAVNAGDFDKAEEYLLPGESMQYDNLCEFAGKIERIEILDEEVGEMFGTEVASVRVKVTLTPAGKSEWLARLEGGTKTFLLEKRKSGWKIVTRL